MNRRLMKIIGMKKYNQTVIKFIAVILSFSFSTGLTLTYLKQQTKDRYIEVSKKVLPTVVDIQCTISRIEPGAINRKQFGRIEGAGVFITASGHILTCAHLFTFPYKLESISVNTYDGWIFPAILLYKEDFRDLALIKIEADSCKFAKLANPNSIQIGQEVLAVGSPFGMESSVTTGVISALPYSNFMCNMIQISAPINPGNSGGPLFNLYGEIIGINSCIMSTNPFFPSWSGVGFSVSGDEIKKFLSIFRGLDSL